MKKAKIFLLALLLALLAPSCKKSEIPADLPDCIRSEIQKFDKDNDCKTALVDEYEFQSQTVYAFFHGECGADYLTTIMSENCDILGTLGGYTGNTVINGEDFSSAVRIRTVWTQP